MNSWICLQCVIVAFPGHTHLILEFICILGTNKKNQMQCSVEQFILQGITWTAFFDRRRIFTLLNCVLDNQLYCMFPVLARMSPDSRSLPSYLLLTILR